MSESSMMIACRFFSLSEVATDRFLAAFSALRMTGFGKGCPMPARAN
jgi:hypothetical protein